MTTQHTAGPWVYGQHEQCVYSLETAKTICEIAHTPLHYDGEATANARLIATAPELLEALQYYVQQHEKHSAVMPEDNENDGKAWQRTLSIARQAIAKAKGQ